MRKRKTNTGIKFLSSRNLAKKLKETALYREIARSDHRNNTLHQIRRWGKFSWNRTFELGRGVCGGERRPDGEIGWVRQGKFHALMRCPVNRTMECLAGSSGSSPPKSSHSIQRKNTLKTGKCGKRVMSGQGQSKGAWMLPEDVKEGNDQAKWTLAGGGEESAEHWKQQAYGGRELSLHKEETWRPPSWSTMRDRDRVTEVRGVER